MGEYGGLYSTLYAEALKHFADIAFNCCFGEIQAAGDSGVVLSSCDPEEDFVLTRGES